MATHPSFRFEAFRKRHPNSPLEKLTIDVMAALEKMRQRGEIDCSDVGTLVFNLLSIAHSMAMFEWIGVHEGDGVFNDAMLWANIRLLWRDIAPAGRRETRERRPE